MELRQLEYFVAVVEEGGFTRAAGRLHVAQPGVSAQVRRLERELGEGLLDRSGGSVTPTPAGEAALPYARAALAAVAGVRDAVAELTGLLRGRLSLGTVGSTGYLRLPDLLAGFHAAHPDVEVTLVEDTSDALVAGLRDGSLDAAFVGLAGPPPPGIEAHALVGERLVAGVPADPAARRRLQLAGEDGPVGERRAERRRGPAPGAGTGHLVGDGTLPVGALRGWPLVTMAPGTGVRACLEAGCAAAGHRPRVAVEARDPVLLARLAAQGLGIAVLPEPAARAEPGLHVVALDPPLRSRLAMAWRAEGATGPAARAFIAHVRAARPEPPEA